MSKNYWLKQSDLDPDYWLKQSDLDPDVFDELLEKYNRFYKTSPSTSITAMEMRGKVYDQLMLLAKEILEDLKSPDEMMTPIMLLSRASLSPHKIVHDVCDSGNEFLENSGVKQNPLNAFDPDKHSAFIWFVSTMIGALKQHDAIRPLNGGELRWIDQLMTEHKEIYA